MRVETSSFFERVWRLSEIDVTSQYYVTASTKADLRARGVTRPPPGRELTRDTSSQPRGLLVCSLREAASCSVKKEVTSGAVARAVKGEGRAWTNRLPPCVDARPAACMSA